MLGNIDIFGHHAVILLNKISLQEMKSTDIYIFLFFDCNEVYTYILHYNLKSSRKSLFCMPIPGAYH